MIQPINQRVISPAKLPDLPRHGVPRRGYQAALCDDSAALKNPGLIGTPRAQPTTAAAKPLLGSTRLPAEVGTGDADVADPLLARAATMLPAQLLQPGEIIILLLKPSPLFILLVPIRFVISVVLLTVFARMLMNKGVELGVSATDVTILAIAIIGLRLFWQMLVWLSHVYVLTDQRIIQLHGVLNVHVFECPLKKIQQTDLVLPLLQRLFGLGTIAFATAGTAAREAYWFMLARPLEAHQKVIETLRRYRR